jgi:LysR family transcriptional regulator, transcriptional activator for aaeXAB operon
MAILAAVVEQGSIRGAARALGLTPSAVSQQLSRLEREVGVSLLQRTTRSLALTEAGALFHQGCVAMVDAARAAREGVARLQDSPVGELRISAPAGFASVHLARALAPFLAAYPALAVRLLVSDEPVDVIGERIDLAVTISRPMRDSSLVRRHLADWTLVLCASPAYLVRHGSPRTPDDLAAHVFLGLPSGHHPTDVLTHADGRQHRVTVAPRITSNTQVMIRQLALHGLGLSFHVEPEIAEDLAAGRLVRLLPEWTAHELSVDVLMPARSPQPAKVRLAADALAAYLREETARERKVTRSAGPRRS